MISLKRDLIISHLFVSYTKLIWRQPVLRPSVEVFDLHNPNSILLIISIKPKMSWFKFKGQARIQTTATFALANLEKFVREIRETLWKIGETLNKIGKPGNFEEVNFFPVSAPEGIRKWSLNLLINRLSSKEYSCARYFYQEKNFTLITSFGNLPYRVCSLKSFIYS